MCTFKVSSFWNILEKQNNVYFSVFPPHLTSPPRIPMYISGYLPLHRLKFILRNLLDDIEKLNCISLLLIFHWIISLKMFILLVHQEKEFTHFLGYISSPTVCIRRIIFYNIYKHKIIMAVNPYYLVVTIFHCPIVGHINIPLFFPECGPST